MSGAIHSSLHGLKGAITTVAVIFFATIMTIYLIIPAYIMDFSVMMAGWHYWHGNSMPLTESWGFGAYATYLLFVLRLLPHEVSRNLALMAVTCLMAGMPIFVLAYAHRALDFFDKLIGHSGDFGPFIRGPTILFSSIMFIGSLFVLPAIWVYFSAFLEKYSGLPSFASASIVALPLWKSIGFGVYQLLSPAFSDTLSVFGYSPHMMLPNKGNTAFLASIVILRYVGAGTVLAFVFAVLRYLFRRTTAS